MREIRMTLREPFQISSGTASARRILLLELEDVDGVTVWSECVAGEKPNYSPETISTCWTAISEWIGPEVLDKGFPDAGRVAGELDRNIRGHKMAKAAVEMGIWALEAEQRGVSLARLLGGTRDSIGTGISLGIQPNPATLAAKAAEALSQGYRKIKLKIKPGADLEYVAAVRQALGANAPLMVDANNAYTVSDFAHLKRLDQFGLVMIEQPLAWDDVVKHAALQKLLETPICLDESITGVDKAEDMLALGSGRIINIKPGRVGGFSTSRAIHDLCEGCGVPVWCGGMLESGIGRAYNVALASLPNFKIPGDISPSARYWERDIIDPEWTMSSEGMVAVPRDTPGIGVTVDVDRVDALTVRSQTLAAS
jgi:O-succinylbenzoate synthase